jgi:putative transposase
MKTGLAEGEKWFYNDGVSPLRRTRHAVYDLKYHFVWVPKYRKLLLTGAIGKRLKEIFQEVAERYEFEIDTMEVMEDHVHLFLVVPPRYAPSEVVNILKSVSAKVLFKEFPALKKELWGGELWSDGYFVRSVGDKVTAEVIRRYIKHQHEEQLGFEF